MTRRLTIGASDDPFTLPLDLEVSTQAILAQRRSGKSYTASVEAEELLDAGQQIAVIDPTGAWWGLLSSADGTKPAYAIAIFGGRKQTAPLDFRTGKALARAMVEHGFSAIFDLSQLEFDEQLEFVRDFCAELLRLNQRPLHLFIDEADTYAPQLLENSLQKKCLGTVSRLIKQGGIGGLGCTLITQRSADLNKKVLSQVQVMTALRLAHKLDIDPVVDWIKRTIGDDFAKEVEAALPTLPIGEAFICSSSLDVGGQRVQVRLRRTFNSGATPKVGEERAEPKMLAQVDVKKLGREIAASAERAIEESPEHLKLLVAQLRAKITELQGKLDKKLPAKAPVTIDVPKKEVDMGFMEEAQAAHEELERLREENAEIPALREQVAQIDELREANQQIPELQERERQYLDIVERFEQSLTSIVAEFSDLRRGLPAPTKVAPALPAPTPKRASQPALPASTSTGAGAGAAPDASNLQGRILKALAEFEYLGKTALPRNVLSAWSNARGGYYTDTIGRMKTLGLVEYPVSGYVRLTKEGRKLAPVIERKVNPRDFFEACVAQAGTGLNERIMRALRAAYPKALTREELSVLVDARGGYYTDTIGRIKGAGFLEYPAKGMVKLQDWTVLR